MANSEVAFKRLEFDFSDPDVTVVTIDVAWSETMMGTKGRYQKTFPARISAEDILLDEVPKFLNW